MCVYIFLVLKGMYWWTCKGVSTNSWALASSFWKLQLLVITWLRPETWSSPHLLVPPVEAFPPGEGIGHINPQPGWVHKTLDIWIVANSVEGEKKPCIALFLNFPSMKPISASIQYDTCSHLLGCFCYILSQAPYICNILDMRPYIHLLLKLNISNALVNLNDHLVRSQFFHICPEKSKIKGQNIIWEAKTWTHSDIIVDNEGYFSWKYVGKESFQSIFFGL